MKITPTKGNIHVTLLDFTQTDSGILVQTTQRNNRAEVVSVGENVTNVSPGDNVIYETKPYTEWMDSGQKHMIIKQENIQAIIQQNEPIQEPKGTESI